MAPTYDSSSTPRQLLALRDWFGKTAQHCNDLLFDQHLIQAGYKIRFAIDFNEIHNFLHPWPVDSNGPAPALESIFAMAYLLFDLTTKPDLELPILLPEYMEEFLEHAAFLKLTGVQTDLNRLRSEVFRLESEYPVLKTAYDATTTEDDSWFTAKREELVHLLRSEFSAIVSLGVTHALNYRRNQQPLVIDFGRTFADLNHFLPAWDTTGRNNVDRQYKLLYDNLYDHVSRTAQHREQLNEGRPPRTNRTCERDAKALLRVTQLNSWLQSHGEREVVYLLTSAHRFYRPAASSFANALELTLTVKGQKLQTSLLRHPFCIVLFLAHWTGSTSTADSQARTALIRRLEYHKWFAPHAAALVSKPPSPTTRSDWSAIEELLGSWANLALSLQRTLLLPSELRSDNVIRNALSLIQLVRSEESRVLDVELLAAQQNVQAGIKNALYVLLKLYIETVVDRSFLVGNAGLIREFPYLLRTTFGQVEEVRSTLRSLGSLDPSKITSEHLNAARKSLMGLLTLFGMEEYQLSSADAVIVGTLLLILFDKLDVAEVLLKSEPSSSGVANTDAIQFLANLVDYRRILRDRPSDPRTYIKVAERLRRRNTHNHPLTECHTLVLDALAWKLQTPDLAKAQQIAHAFVQLLERTPLDDDSPAIGSTSNSVRYRITNNYVTALGWFAEGLNSADFANEAFRSAVTVLEPQLDDSSSEVRDTVGVAYWQYARLGEIADKEARKRYFALAKAHIEYACANQAGMSIPSTAVVKVMEAKLDRIEKDIQAHS